MATTSDTKFIPLSIDKIDFSAKLCLVTVDKTAWFTTLDGDIGNQSGENWYQPGYEFSAGFPFVYVPGTAIKPYRLFRVRWAGHFIQPHELAFRSALSVYTINILLDTFWLVAMEERDFITDKGIKPGATLKEFIDFVTHFGGSVTNFEEYVWSS